jgi:hypothetical protein
MGNAESLIHPAGSCARFFSKNPMQTEGRGEIGSDDTGFPRGKAGNEDFAKAWESVAR